jgi:hypothetical protein
MKVIRSRGLSSHKWINVLLLGAGQIGREWICYGSDFGPFLMLSSLAFPLSAMGRH